MSELDSVQERAYRRWELQHAFNTPSITSQYNIANMAKSNLPNNNKRHIIILKNKIIDWTGGSITINFGLDGIYMPITIPCCELEIKEQELTLTIVIPHKLAKLKGIPARFYKKSYYTDKTGRKVYFYLKS